MADLEIHELSASGANLLDASLIAGVSGTNPARKYTGLQVRAIEKAEREAQDNVIEASCGLNADGTFPAYSGTNYLDSETNLYDATEALDAAIGEGAALQTKVVAISAADILTLHTVDKELIAAPGADNVIEIISMVADNLYLDDNYIIAASDEIRARYDSGNDILSWNEAFIEAASCHTVHLGTFSSNVVMGVNKAVNLYAESAITKNSANTAGTYSIKIVYRVISLGACPT